MPAEPDQRESNPYTPDTAPVDKALIEEKFPVRFEAKLMKDFIKGVETVRVIDPTAEVIVQAEMTEAQFRELTSKTIKPFLSMKGSDTDEYEININSFCVLEEFCSGSIQLHMAQAMLRQKYPDNPPSEKDTANKLLKEAQMKPRAIHSLLRALDQWPWHEDFPDEELLEFAQREPLELADLYQEK